MSTVSGLLILNVAVIAAFFWVYLVNPLVRQRRESARRKKQLELLLRAQSVGLSQSQEYVLLISIVRILFKKPTLD